MYNLMMLKLDHDLLNSNFTPFFSKTFTNIFSEIYEIIDNYIGYNTKKYSNVKCSK